MATDDLIEVEGVIEEVHPAGMFTVKLNDSDARVMSHLSGKMRKHRIRVVLGDRVTVQISPYDLGKGRIAFRHK